jgi:hypothetical protein
VVRAVTVVERVGFCSGGETRTTLIIIDLN